MPVVGAIGLTPAGQAKIQAAIRAVAEAAQIGVARTVIELRAQVAARAPSSEEEARLLSRGVNTNNAGGIGFGIGVIGTPEGGRFLREGGMMSVREAILTEPIATRRQFDRVLGGIGSPEYINARTGFSWNTRKRGIQGPTFPFNRAYVQALENGGLVWLVVPRADNVRNRLEPEPGITARSMLKTLPPQRMYRSTLYDNQTAIKRELGNELRQAFKDQKV